MLTLEKTKLQIIEIPLGSTSYLREHLNGNRWLNLRYEIMHIKDITLKILIIGIEDVSSLHEILWDFSDENLMTETKLQIVKVAEKLLQLGLIKLYWCKESYGKLTEIPLNNEALALIIQEKYWAPPEQNSLWLRFETTKAGEAFYKKIYQDGEASFLLL